MSDAWIGFLGAVAVGLIALVGEIVVSRNNRKKIAAEEQTRQTERDKKDAVWRARLEDRLDSVEHKLDVHNGYAEKLGSLDKSMAVMATEIANIKEKL